MEENDGGSGQSDLRRAAADLAVAGSPGRAALLLARLDLGKASTGALCVATGQSPYARSFDLARLTAAGLMHRRRSGKSPSRPGAAGSRGRPWPSRASSGFKGRAFGGARR